MTIFFPILNTSHFCSFFQSFQRLDFWITLLLTLSFHHLLFSWVFCPSTSPACGLEQSFFQNFPNKFLQTYQPYSSLYTPNHGSLNHLRYCYYDTSSVHIFLLGTIFLLVSFMVSFIFHILNSSTRYLCWVIQSRGSEFWSYEVDLRNPVMQNDVTLRVTNSKIFIEILLSSYLLDFIKYWIKLQISNSKIKLLFFYFWVTNLNLKNKKLNFRVTKSKLKNT